jgi:hypothetical protein
MKCSGDSPERPGPGGWGNEEEKQEPKCLPGPELEVGKVPQPDNLQPPAQVLISTSQRLGRSEEDCLVILTLVGLSCTGHPGPPNAQDPRGESRPIGLWAGYEQGEKR